MDGMIEVNDAYAAAWLIFNGYDPTFEAFGRHLGFYFPSTPKVSKLLNEFHRPSHDNMVSLLSYVEAIRKVRGYIFAFRHGNLDV